MPLRVRAFESNGSMSSIHIHVILFSETRLKPHEMLYIVVR
jgi:hypothetical protein